MTEQVSDRPHRQPLQSGQLAPGFVGLVGLRIDEVRADRVRASLEVGEQHHQPAGLVHGGVYATIVETVASIGGHAAVRDRGLTVVGVSNMTDFLRSHRTGSISAVGEPIHVGRTQQLWQVLITRDRDGALLSRGQLRLHNVDPARDW